MEHLQEIALLLSLRQLEPNQDRKAGLSLIHHNVKHLQLLLDPMLFVFDHWRELEFYLILHCESDLIVHFDDVLVRHKILLGAVDDTGLALVEGFGLNDCHIFVKVLSSVDIEAHLTHFVSDTVPVLEAKHHH